jgi:phage shock protein A
VDDTETLKAQIQVALKNAIPAIASIATDPKTTPGVRVRAFEALADRGGLPAIKATMVQVESYTTSVTELKAKRQELEGKQAEIGKEIADLRKYLEPAAILPVPGKE